MGLDRRRRFFNVTPLNFTLSSLRSFCCRAFDGFALRERDRIDDTRGLRIILPSTFVDRTLARAQVRSRPVLLSSLTERLMLSRAGHQMITSIPARESCGISPRIQRVPSRSASADHPD
jgi:hypothetical protein